MNWPVYRFSVEPTAKERREGAPVVKVDHRLFTDMLSQSMLHDIARSKKKADGDKDAYIHHESIGFMALCAEFDWLKAGKPTLFIESRELVEQLVECSYSLDFDGICLPGNILSISFPQGTKVAGVELPPCLFHRTVVPGEFSPTGERYERIGLVTRISWGENGVSGATNQEQLDMVLTEKADPSWFDPHIESRFEEDEAHRMAVLFRVVLGLSAYISAFPEMMRPGFPEAKERVLKPLRKALNQAQPTVLFQHERFRLTPSAHFRSAHFRTLRDQRYKRNPDGSLRSVFVSPSFVGGRDLDPSTVEELKKTLDN